MTACPKCGNKFSRLEGKVNESEARVIRQERYQKKRDKNAQLFGSDHACASARTIRGEQVPLSTAEARFKARAAEKGWRPHRPSWPDFLVETGEGLIAVEVKSRSDSVSKTQRETFNILEAAGVRVYLWRDSKKGRDRLVKWENGIGLAKVGLD